MRKINKNFTPLSIVSQTIERHFLENKNTGKHIKSDCYKIIREDLEIIYHSKCAYCEKDLSDTDKPIEHYRPKSECKEFETKKEKNGYFWLAYSWNNLLLSCTQCNRAKSTYFDISTKTNAKYSNETFKELQYKDYDTVEQPLLINPEQISETELNEQFYFELNGNIVGKTEKMKYTINVCDLNRDGLKHRRFILLNTYLNDYEKAISKNNSNKKQIIEDILEKLDDETTEKSEFTAWRKFIIDFFTKIANKIN